MSVASKNSEPAKLIKGRKSPAPKRVYNDRISDEVGNYEKHPFFVKKANEMKALLDRVGLPKHFATRSK